MADQFEVLKTAYREFNARHIDAVLALMVPDVRWPNATEGVYVQGHDEVRSYWLRQWESLHPVVEPVSMRRDEQGRIAVEVHQVVRDRQGGLLMDRIVHHIYGFRNGLIEEMTIE